MDTHSNTTNNWNVRKGWGNGGIGGGFFIKLVNWGKVV